MERFCRQRLPSRPDERDEDGFTIVEVLVAGIVLVLGSLAVFMTFASAIHNVQRSRETQIGISVAQREMERIRVIPYASVALSTTPTPLTAKEKTEKTEQSEPRFRVRLEPVTEFDLQRPTAKEEWRPVMTAAGGLVKSESKGTEKVTASDGTEVEVFRYVTCEEAGKTYSNCQAKRVVIDVIPIGKANLGPAYKHGYYELQSTLVNPLPPRSP